MTQMVIDAVVPEVRASGKTSALIRVPEDWSIQQIAEFSTEHLPSLPDMCIWVPDEFESIVVNFTEGYMDIVMEVRFLGPWMDETKGEV